LTWEATELGSFCILVSRHHCLLQEKFIGSIVIIGPEAMYMYM
jgi:hypothetical protein